MQTDSACPDENICLAFLDGTLPQEEAQAIEVHMAQCPICTELFMELGHLMFDQTQDAPVSAVEAIHPTKMLGRYQLKKILGAGGMGVVYEAYDPELARQVAIKIIRPDKVDALHGQRKARLKKEARALAALNHPNVLTVFDVGEDDDRIWIAMAFIDGHPVSDWIISKQPSWQNILDTYINAAKGLQAAHDHNLIHRDIKPDNILMGEDGRVLLMDFGLAHSTHDTSSKSIQTITDAPLTMTGMIVGTPSYMSPEQLAGQHVDARSDQFSLCVALFEGLYGFRPFQGNTLAALAASVNAGQIARPRSQSIPDALFDVLERGMSPRPVERFEDIHALIKALESAKNPLPTRSRLPLMALVMGIFVLVGGVGIWKASTNDQKETKPQVNPIKIANTQPNKKTVNPIVEPKSQVIVPIEPAKKIVNVGVVAAKLAMKTLPKVAKKAPKIAKVVKKRTPIKRKATNTLAMGTKSKTTEDAKPPTNTIKQVIPAPVAGPKVQHGAQFTEAQRQKAKTFHHLLNRQYIPACMSTSTYARCKVAIKRVTAEVSRTKPQLYLEKLLKQGANPGSVKVLKALMSGFFTVASQKAVQADQCTQALNLQMNHIRIWALGAKPGSFRWKSANNVKFWRGEIIKKNAKCQDKLSP